MKKWITVILLLTLLAGCAAPEVPTPTTEVTTQPPTTVAEEIIQIGISMPTEQDLYWQESGRLLQEKLTALGFAADLRFAMNDAREQARQLESLLEKGVACLIVGAVDSLELVEPLQKARSLGIPVIAYDRLLMETDAVSSYVTFDYEAMGTAMAQQLIQDYSLETAQEEKRSYTAEFFMGSPDDNNAVLLHKGLMTVLQPWLDSGVLKCPSGRVDFSDTYTLRWDPDSAAQQLTSLLKKTYKEGTYPDICIAASDALAGGCLSALTAAGCEAQDLPAITGQGGGLEALQRIVAGQQAFSVFTDLRLLTDCCVELVTAHLAGVAPKAQSSMDNHVITVPTVMCSAPLIHLENYRQIMLDSKLYTEDTLP